MYDRSYWRLIRDPGFSWLLAAQFLGALNDNIYRWSITFFALDLARRPGGGWDADVLVATIGATLMAPFLIFSNYAGQLADRFSKRSVLIATKSLEIVAMMRSGFPDIQWTLEETVVEGNVIAARFTMRGTHRGAFMGTPPTGKTIAVQALNIYRLSHGKIVSEVGQPDLLGLMQQIGGLPRP